MSKTEETGVLRFFNNPSVMESALLSDLYSSTKANCPSSHVLLLQDTVELNYNGHNGLFKVNDPDLGVISDNKSTGLYVHPSLVVEASTGFPVGYSHMKLYQHRFDRPSRSQRRPDLLPIEEKESFRWIEGPQESKSVLANATKVTVISDQEGDIYEILARIPSNQYDLIVRSHYDRQVDQGEKISAVLEKVAWQGQTTFFVQGNSKRKARKVNAQIRWKQVQVHKPNNKTLAQLGGWPDPLSLYAVEIKETEQSVAAGESPVHWRLWTSHSVKSLSEALTIILWYTQRWWIEELFRLIKTQGFQIERSQFATGKALKKMIILTFEQALKVLMLKQSRANKNPIEAQRTFSQAELLCLIALAPTVEGRTEKQKNPFPYRSLAWATWIIARLAGWKPANMEKKPPGVITLTRGIKRFNQQFHGFQLAQALQNQIYENQKDKEH